MYIGRRTRNCARISLESLTPVSLLWLPDAPGVRGRRLELRSCLSLESLAPVSVRWLQENLGKHRCQCGCGQAIRLQPRHYWRVPRYVHGHQNRRGYWRVLQLREAGYLTVSEVAKALGIGRPPRCGGGREPSIPGQPGSVGSGSITRPTSNCSDAGSKCRQRQPTGNSPGAAQRRLRRATPNTISSLGQASVRMLTEIGCGGWI